MKGWVGIAVFVAAYDTWAAVAQTHTLSHQFKVASRAHPVLVTTCTAYLVLHLYGAIPQRLDPLCIYPGVVSRGC